MLIPHPTRLRRFLTILSASLMLVACVVTAWGCETKVKPALGALTIVCSGDTAGWIVPCGCTSNQSGGLARRGSFVKALRATEAVVLVDVGGAVAGTSAYDRVKFEAILHGEMRMGLVAHNIGLAEAKLGADYLRELSAERRIPFVSCNVTDAKGQLLADPQRIVAVAGRRVAFVGVLSENQSVPGLKIESPQAAVLDLLPKIKGKYDHLIVLAYLPEVELRALATALPEADAVIGGPTGQSIAPERNGPTWLAAATNKGKFIISLAVANNDRTWRGAVHELNESYSNDAEQVANVEEFHRTLAARDFAPRDTSFLQNVAQGLPAEFRIAGSERCLDCHTQDCEKWKASKHATAWQSLVKTGSHVDAYCQQCHTTGYGLPGGFESVTTSSRQTSVGCEDCHGPASAHVAEPSVRTPFAQQVGQYCERCHDRENSPRFSYETFWLLISHGGKTP